MLLLEQEGLTKKTSRLKIEYYYKEETDDVEAEEETDDVEAEEETDDVEDEYGCKYYHASAGSLPIYNQTTWNLIRKTYLDVVGEEKYNQNIKVGMSEKNGFAVSTHVGYSDGKGRGIFVDTPVKKGELVWKEIQTADFDNSSTFKTFLNLLPKSLVCDVREWAYVADIYIGTDGKRYFPETNDETKVSYKWRIDIEEGSIINNEADSPNIGCDLEAAKEVKGGCRVASWALRDLEVGEEILMDYGDFVVDGTVPE
jgi:hypothetical protein